MGFVQVENMILTGHVPHTKALLIINKGAPRCKPGGLLQFLFIVTNK